MAEALKIVAISRYKDPQGFRAAQTRFLKYRGFAKSCPIVMNLPPINLVDAQKLDAAVAPFEAQLREHEITTPPRRFACGNSDSNSGPALCFMLVANAPDGGSIGVAYASSLLSLELGGVSGWLEELYVLPQWRGRGIGSRLVAEVIAHARELGWRALDLEVEASHQRAISLYALHQFQPHSRSRYYRVL
jgi:ribosomal protein S18 acetylase RimI-like enzyme